MNETVEYPYADLSGMVVVKNQSGQKLVLDVYGNEIISAGQYEDLAPARDGCVWAKQNGLWGLLQVQDYTENNADIILPDGCVAPDVTLSRIDSLCTLLGLSERRYRGDVMNVEKDINYNAVEEKLKKLRADSIKYLETALK